MHDLLFGFDNPLRIVCTRRSTLSQDRRFNPRRVVFAREPRYLPVEPQFRQNGYRRRDVFERVSHSDDASLGSDEKRGGLGISTENVLHLRRA